MIRVVDLGTQCFVVILIAHSGRWIDLPHVKNGFKPPAEECGLTNPVYSEVGPSVNEPPYQVRKRALHMRPLDE